MFWLLHFNWKTKLGSSHDDELCWPFKVQLASWGLKQVCHETAQMMAWCYFWCGLLSILNSGPDVWWQIQTKALLSSLLLLVHHVFHVSGVSERVVIGSLQPCYLEDCCLFLGVRWSAGKHKSYVWKGGAKHQPCIIPHRLWSGTGVYVWKRETGDGDAFEPMGDKLCQTWKHLNTRKEV